MKIVLANPRGFCAGVEWAVAIVELALLKYSNPIYVRHEIVHNLHVIELLSERGVVFVESLDEVPHGATIFSAHGVAFVIEDEASAESVRVQDPDQVAYVTQTTLSVEHTARMVAVLRRRFPKLIRPHCQDICYATSNRQGAIRTLAQQCDIVIVLGADHSSNSVRLREVAEAAGLPAYLIASDEHADQSWFRDKQTIGVSSGASVPDVLVQRPLEPFRTWWPGLTEERIEEPEALNFRLPRELLARQNGEAVPNAIAAR